MKILLIFSALGYGERLKRKVLAHYKLRYYALRADFQFGFCKNTQKLDKYKCSNLHFYLYRIYFN